MFRFENSNCTIIGDGTVVTYPEHGGYRYTVRSVGSKGEFYCVTDDRGTVVAHQINKAGDGSSYNWARGVQLVERAIKRASADRNVIEEAERLKLYENEEFLAMDYDDDVAAYDAAHGIK